MQQTVREMRPRNLLRLITAAALAVVLLTPSGAKASPDRPSRASNQDRERPEPLREFRAVWVATVDNIDFPTNRNLPPEKQKEELLAILDLAGKLRLNAVIFQVRPMADAVYRSALEPWSEFLTGEMGRPQAFDPLEFLVAEAHRRGILVHAWFNPYRAFHPSAKTISNDHISRILPDAVRSYGRYRWIDPTEPAGQEHSLKVIADVVRRYDIDGVHFDDYFYPYAEKDAAGNKIEFPDEKNWNLYVRATPITRRLSRDDWRRANVDRFIEAVGREIKQIRPDIVYGISPFGIWRPMPEKGIAGFDAFAELFADSRKWLRDGTIDYLAPQLYWETARQGLSFPVLLDWWREQNLKKRFIFPGVAAYRINSTPTFTAGEIARQIEKTREHPETTGAIFFSERSLRKDFGGIQATLSDGVYTRAALVPRFAWIKVPPMAPPRVALRRAGAHVRVSWTPRGRRKAFWFVVYALDRNGWSTSVVPASVRSISLSAERRIRKVAVTSVDRLGNESAGPQ